MINKKVFLNSIIIFLIGTLFTGCGVSGKFFDEVNRPSESVYFYKQLDNLVEKEEINNAYGIKVSGFPYLRSNRFFSYIKDTLKNKEQKEAWVKYLQELDLSARVSEIKNLSDSSIKKLGKSTNASGRDEILTKLKHYSNKMLENDQKNPHFFDTLISLVETPDDYSTAMRVFGGYPFAYLPVAFFSDRLFEKMKKTFKIPVDKLKVHGKLQHYSNKNHFFKNTEVKRIFAESPKDTLGLPLLSAKDKNTLLNSFAPDYEQDASGRYDRPGEVIWKDEELNVDTNKPSVYYYFSHMFYKDKPVIQLNYVIWYSKRDGPLAPWYEKGVLDGFNFRVTLDTKGTPVMVDIVHQCGCFHFFVPNKKVVKSIVSQSFQFDALVLSWLPEEFPKKRISLRVASGGHLIENINIENTSEKIYYKLVPYENLVSLPYGKSRKSMFDTDGIGYGTERAEPYFFFPMGVPEIGAMRQRSHHPTKLIGKAHFDDPMFLNDSFEFK